MGRRQKKGAERPKPRDLRLVPKDEEVFPASLLERPLWLPEGAAKLWDALVVKLTADGVLQDVHGPAVTNVAMSYYFTMHASALLVRDGMTSTDPEHGDRIRKHPAFQMWRESQAAFGKWADRFQLSPAKGAEVLAEAEEELSEIERLLSGRP